MRQLAVEGGTGGQIGLAAGDFRVTRVEGKLHPTGQEFTPATGLLPGGITEDAGRRFVPRDLAFMRDAYLALQSANVPDGIERPPVARLIEDQARMRT